MSLGNQVASKEALYAYADWAQRAGWNLSENSKFGGIKATHVAGSWHAKDLALDLNWPGESGNYSPQEVAHATRAVDVANSFGLGRIRALYGTVGSAATHKNHVHVDCGPTSNLGRGLQYDARKVSLVPYHVQAAIHAERDNQPGPDSRKRLAALKAASNYGGNKFPYGVEFAQDVVGTTKDGKWGDASKAAHDRTVIALQAALGIKQDAKFGPDTEAHAEAVFGAF